MRWLWDLHPIFRPVITVLALTYAVYLALISITWLASIFG